MNLRSINCNHLNGFSFYSWCIFSLNMFLGLKSVAKDLKMDLRFTFNPLWSSHALRVEVYGILLSKGIY